MAALCVDNTSTIPTGTAGSFRRVIKQCTSLLITRPCCGSSIISHHSLQRLSCTQFWPCCPNTPLWRVQGSGSPRSPDQSSNQSEKLELGSESARGRRGHAGCQDWPKTHEWVQNVAPLSFVNVKPEKTYSSVPTSEFDAPTGIGP